MVLSKTLTRCRPKGDRQQKRETNMANIKHNKSNIVIALATQGAAGLSQIPTDPKAEGRPSADVVNAAYEMAEEKGVNDETLEAFRAWITKNYPESTGTPGAKGLPMGGFRNYKAAQSDTANTASIRVPVEHLGVASGAFVRVEALTVEDARALLARLTNGDTVLVARAA